MLPLTDPSPLGVAEAPPGPAFPFKRVAARSIPLAALWWMLNPDDPSSWLVGAPLTILAAVLSVRLSPGQLWQIRGAELFRFVPYFLLVSFRGGVDVAWRALHPRLPIQPGLIDYPSRLPEGSARTFMIYVVSLLPGTLSADFRGSTLVLHALNDPRASVEGVETLEKRIAALFGVRLAPAGGRT